MVPEILLSICIPTYNRASYLEKCLQSIVQQAGNNGQVEVLISDNVSNDNTREVCERFVRQFDNVKYFVNETNIGADQNIIRVLKIANGKYLKLLNDYCEFSEGGLLKVLEIVTNHASTREVLFFPNGVSYLKKKEFHYSTGLDGFLKIASFWSSWIGAVGFWKEDFHMVIETYQFKTTNFLQTELLFESVLLKKKAVTYSRSFMVAHEVINKKTGYNFFELFIESYFNTYITSLRKERKISWLAYYREKNKFFADFIFFWYKNVKIKNRHSTDISPKGVEGLVFKTYKYDPIFYLYLIFLPFYLLSFYIKKALRK
jgi:glycosyltransferase involved in cell wall biosynthesis